MPLMMPQDLHLSGSGLFGAMLSHPSTHDAAQALIDDVERKWNEQEELQREKEEAEEAAALGLTVPKPPPATGRAWWEEMQVASGKWQMANGKWQVFVCCRCVSLR